MYIHKKISNSNTRPEHLPNAIVWGRLETMPDALHALSLCLDL